MLVPEWIKSRPEPTIELPSVQSSPPAPASISLEVITSPDPQTPYLVVAPNASLVSTTTVRLDTSSSIIAPSLVEVYFEKKFIAEFYKSLRRCLSIILKGSRNPFESLNLILFCAIESIKDVGGAIENAFLEQMVKNLERDVGEWCCQNQSDLTPLIK